MTAQLVTDVIVIWRAAIRTRLVSLDETAVTTRMTRLRSCVRIKAESIRPMGARRPSLPARAMIVYPPFMIRG